MKDTFCISFGTSLLGQYAKCRHSVAEIYQTAKHRAVTCSNKPHKAANFCWDTQSYEPLVLQSLRSAPLGWWWGNVHCHPAASLHRSGQAAETSKMSKSDQPSLYWHHPICKHAQPRQNWTAREWRTQNLGKAKSEVFFKHLCIYVCNIEIMNNDFVCTVTAFREQLWSAQQSESFSRWNSCNSVIIDIQLSSAIFNMWA